MTKAQSERVIAVCEEFTDVILFDDIHKSIIINITIDRFPTLRRELKRYRYSLKHMTKMQDSETITCVFIQN
jgi:hypothetical protein